MPAFYTQLTLYAAAIAGAVAVGGLFPMRLRWVRNHLPALLSFAAGVMLGASFLHLLPAAYEAAGDSAATWILIGFLFLYAFEKFVTVHICEALDCEVHSIGMSAFIGLAIHALTEGVALGAGMLTAGVGWIVLMSIFLHKLPAALALTSILLHENYRQRTIFTLQSIFFLMVPLGAVLVHRLFAMEGAHFLGAALGFSTGTFLHISLSDLLPEVHRSKYRKTWAFTTFLFGLAIMVLMRNHEGH